MVSFRFADPTSNNPRKLLREQIQRYLSGQTRSDILPFQAFWPTNVAIPHPLMGCTLSGTVE
jgi:hypothetical protein